MIVKISIHAPRTGSDNARDAVARLDDDISIHAPRTGSDADCSWSSPPSIKFQSTLPARGATLPRQALRRSRLYFNPRSPHGERRN